MQRITRAFSVFFLSSLVATSTVAAAASSCSTNAILISTGLRNLGNTCYLNAQLQCAYHIPKVRHLVLRGNDNNDDEKTPGSPALQALRILFQDMTAAAAVVTTKSSSTASTVLSLSNKKAAPVVLCQTLGIPLYQQQDSQEFWKLFLPALQYPPLTDLYQGSYQDTIIALDGSNRQKRREEVFLDLSLDLLQHDHDNNNDKVHNLQSSLQQFVKAEILSVAQGNGWRPPPLSQPHETATAAGACMADKIDAKKGIQLYPQGLPSILQLHLKRFHFDWNTETTSKLNVPFEFTPELDLTKLCCQDNDNNNNKEEEDVVIYDLQAVIVHMGEYDSGHYYAYVRPDMRSDEWYRFNDEIVTRVTLKEVLEDSIGGLAGTSGSGGADDDESSLTSCSESGKKKKKGFFAKLLESFLGESSSSSSGHYGFGGPTSNAYVLQYVRRRDIPALYDPEDVE